MQYGSNSPAGTTNNADATGIIVTRASRQLASSTGNTQLPQSPHLSSSSAAFSIFRIDKKQHVQLQCNAHNQLEGGDSNISCYEMTPLTLSTGTRNTNGSCLATSCSDVELMSDVCSSLIYSDPSTGCSSGHPDDGCDEYCAAATAACCTHRNNGVEIMRSSSECATEQLSTEHYWLVNLWPFHSSTTFFVSFGIGKLTLRFTFTTKFSNQSIISFADMRSNGEKYTY